MVSGMRSELEVNLPARMLGRKGHDIGAEHGFEQVRPGDAELTE